LPIIEGVEDLSPPTASAVAQRALVLGAMVAVGFDDSAEEWRAWLSDVGLAGTLSGAERSFFEKEPSDQERIDATWLEECLQVLLWGLSLVELDHFARCDEDLVRRLPHAGTQADVQDFIASARLRPFEEIYQQCDLLYRLHWVARHLDARELPRELSEEVVRERHRAINWLTGVETDWDEVATDT
jgi:hypothetical protein